MRLKPGIALAPKLPTKAMLKAGEKVVRQGDQMAAKIYTLVLMALPAIEVNVDVGTDVQAVHIKAHGGAVERVARVLNVSADQVENTWRLMILASIK